MNNEFNNNLGNQNNGVNNPLNDNLNNSVGVQPQIDNINNTMPNSNFNQPLNNYTNMNNNQNKSNIKIVIIIVLAIILLIAIGGGAFYLGQKMSDNDSDTNNNNNQTVNEDNNQTNNEAIAENQNVVVNGIRYSIPTDYIYEISDDQLTLYDSTQSWAAVFANIENPYSDLRNAALYLTEQGFSIRNISGTEVVYVPTVVEGIPYNLYYLNFNNETMMVGIFYQSTLPSSVESAMIDIAKNATISRDIQAPNFNIDEFYDGLDLFGF